MTTTSTLKQTFICHLCDYSGNNKAALTKHVEEGHDKITYPNIWQQSAIEFWPHCDRQIKDTWESLRQFPESSFTFACFTFESHAHTFKGVAHKLQHVLQIQNHISNPCDQSFKITYDLEMVLGEPRLLQMIWNQPLVRLGELFKTSTMTTPLTLMTAAP